MNLKQKGYTSDTEFSRREINEILKGSGYSADWFITHRIKTDFWGCKYIVDWGEGEPFANLVRTEIIAIPIKTLYWRNGKPLSEYDVWQTYGVKTYEKDIQNGVKNLKYGWDYSTDTSKYIIPLSEIKIVESTIEAKKYYYTFNLKALEELISLCYKDTETLRNDINKTKAEFKRLQKRLENLQGIIDYKHGL